MHVNIILALEVFTDTGTVMTTKKENKRRKHAVIDRH